MERLGARPRRLPPKLGKTSELQKPGKKSAWSSAEMPHFAESTRGFMSTSPSTSSYVAAWFWYATTMLGVSDVPSSATIFW